MTDSYTVEFPEEGRTIEVPANTPILEAAEQAGMDLPYQCRMGVCGVCSAKRIGDGDVEQTEGMFLSDAEKEDGYVLTCVARALSDLELESGSGP
jgi:ferredoxin